MIRERYLFLGTFLLGGFLTWLLVTSDWLGYLNSESPALSIPVAENSADPDKAPIEEQIRQRLDTVKIHQVDFQDDTFEECLDFLRLRFRMREQEMGLKPLKPSKLVEAAESNGEDDLGGIPDESTIRHVSYKAQNVSVLHVIEEICQQADVTFKITANGLTFVANQTPVQEVVRDMLNKMIILRVDFQGDTLEEILDFLKLRFKESSGGQGIGIIIRYAIPPEDADDALEDVNEVPTITYRARNVSAAELLDNICKQAKMQWEVTEYALLIKPIKHAPQDQ